MRRRSEPDPRRIASDCSFLERNKKTLVLLTMVAPTAIWLLLLRYLPMGGITGCCHSERPAGKSRGTTGFQTRTWT